MGARVAKQDVKVPHFYFGEVSFRNEYNKELMVVSKLMLHKDDYDDWLRLYLQVKKMHKQYLLVPQSHQIQTIKKYFTCCQCPADFQISICYERFEHLYKEELAQRQKTNKPYAEEELFLILYNFLIALKEFQINGKKVGDIRTAQIVITNQKTLKLINLASFPWQISAFDKILDKLDNTTKFYLAPEQIDCLKKHSRDAKFPNSKTQAFSLGMTILDIALLQSSQDIYKVNPRSIDLTLLEKRLQTLGHKYPQLKNYVSLLLKTAPEDRYSAGELWSCLKIYSQKILQNAKFVRKQSKENQNLAEFRKRPKI